MIEKNSSIICVYLEFEAPTQKIKKIDPEKNSLHFVKWNFLALILKISYIFLYIRKWKPRKKCLIFQETETLKKLLIFREIELFSKSSKKFLIVQEKEALKKFIIFYQKKDFLIFQKTETQKKFLLFQKNFQSPKNENFLYISKNTYE